MRSALVRWIWVVVCFVALHVNAQNTEIDSLKDLLGNYEGLKRWNVEYQIGQLYLDLPEHYNLALDYGRSLFRNAAYLRDSALMMKASFLKAAAFRRLEQFDSAVVLYLKVIAFAERQKALEYKKYILYSSDDLGVVYTLQALYDKALSYNFKSLALSRKLQDNDAMAITLTNIGQVYFKLKNYDKAINYYKDALALDSKPNNDGPSSLLIDLALCYALKGEFQEAKKYNEKALNGCAPRCSNHLLIEGEYCSGIIAFGLNNDEDAERHFIHSRELAIRVNDLRFQLENIVYLVQIYLEQENIAQAEKYLEEAEAKASLSEYNLLLMEIYREHYVLLGKKKDLRKEAMYQRKYIHLRDSIYGEELTQHLMAVHAENEERENQSRIEAQEKVLGLKEEIITRQTILNILAVSIALLLIALIFILYRNNVQKKRNNKLLEQKVQERTIELQESFEMMQRVYKEQDEIVLKASNDMKNPLSTLKGLCEVAAKEFDDDESSQYVKSISSIVDQIEEKVNSLTKPDDQV